MVSHTRVKTPTAAAAFLIDHLRHVQERIEQAETFIQQYVTNHIRYQQQRISQLALIIPSLAQRRFSDECHKLEMLQNRLPVAIERLMTHQKHLLAQIELKLQSFDPQILLSRGYSITLKNGHVIRNASELMPGDEIETRVEKGTFKSIVK